jgi:hypothetical protein
MCISLRRPGPDSQRPNITAFIRPAVFATSIDPTSRIAATAVPQVTPALHQSHTGSLVAVTFANKVTPQR